MATDGRASFAAFIYEEGGAVAIQDYREDKVVGFDGGDQIRSASLSLQNLADVNVLRIDGNAQ